MKKLRIIIPLIAILLMMSMVAFGTPVPLGPFYDDGYFSTTDDALILDSSIGDLNDVDTTDIADEKILQYNFSTSKWECEDAPSGYTNLTSFINQTAWRVFYSNADGDVTELALGADGTYLKSNGATSAPTFTAPAGGGDALTTDPLSQFAATTSSELIGVISDETGTGKAVFATSPTFTTPLLGTPTSGILTNCTFPTLNQSTTGTAAKATILETARTIGGVSFNGSANIGINLLADETPELYTDLDCNDKDLTEVKTVQFEGVHAIGNSGSTETVDWQNGAYQSITIDEACVISFSNEYVGTLNLRVTYGGSFALTFDGGITLLEEGGVEIVTTDASGVDLLIFKNWGTADTYDMGALLDLKD